jgi:hypothetical protein
VNDKDRSRRPQVNAGRKPALESTGWRRSFAKLSDIRAAVRDVQRIVDREFSKIEVAAWK